MLAPRNKLWSTPTEVMDVAIDLFGLSHEDILYDIGAGDGRFIMHCHKKAGCRCTGVEINEERAERARKDIAESGYLDSHCTIITGNALEQVQAWKTLITTVEPSCCRKLTNTHFFALMSRITHQQQPYSFISFQEG